MFQVKRFQKLFVLLAATVLSFGTVSAQHLNDQQKELFRKEAEKLLKTYGDVVSFTTKDGKFDMSKANSLVGTFIDTQKPIVFNDLLPAKTDGEKYLSPTAYRQFAERNYPDGLDVVFRIDDINIETLEVKGYHTAIVKATKKVRGFYSNKRIHSYSGVLYFFVQASFADAQIQKIGISLVADPEKYAQMQSKKNYGGLYVGLTGAMNKSMLMNQTIISNTSWEMGLGNGFSPAIDVYYMITKGFGVGTGLRFGSYSSVLSIKNYNKQLGKAVTDQDGDQYYPYFNIPNLEELNTYKTMDIPIGIKLRGGKRKVGMYFDMGMIYSVFRDATYTLTGQATTMGYYNSYNVMLSNIPEYNFTTTEYNAASFEMSVPNKNLSAFASTGITFVVYPDIAMKVGINSLYGLTDLLYNKPKHIVDFYSTTGLSGDKTNLLSLSVEFGVYYRVLK